MKGFMVKKLPNSFIHESNPIRHCYELGEVFTSREDAIGHLICNAIQRGASRNKNDLARWLSEAGWAVVEVVIKQGKVKPLTQFDTMPYGQGHQSNLQRQKYMP